MAKKTGRLAGRYARALLSSLDKKERSVKGSGKEATGAQKLSQELEKFAELWETDAELSSIMLSPMFAREQRAKALDSVSKEFGLSDSALSFVRLLFKRDRLSHLPEISRAFSILADSDASVVRVLVRTARKIDSSEVKATEEAISKKLGGAPEFIWEVESSLLGGMVIEYSGQVLDGSLNGQLSRLERELTS